MRRERRKHVNYLPVLCISVSALLFVLSLNFIINLFRFKHMKYYIYSILDITKQLFSLLLHLLF